MNSAGSAARATIFPKQYFTLSKTWDVWNKLSVADVYNLREEDGFKGQDIYFWLNNPIRYVRLVGMVVQIDVVANGKFILITLDDFSGANIEVKVERRPTIIGSDTQYPSNTLIDNLEFCDVQGNPGVRIDNKSAAVGTTIRAQGIIKSFMQERQMILKRVFMVQDTNEEAAWWTTVTSWKTETLEKPWVLTADERRAFDDEMRRADLKERKKAEHRRKRAERVQRHEAKYEQMQQKSAIALDAGALGGSDIINRPWD